MSHPDALHHLFQIQEESPFPVIMSQLLQPLKKLREVTPEMLKFSVVHGFTLGNVFDQFMGIIMNMIQTFFSPICQLHLFHINGHDGIEVIVHLFHADHAADNHRDQRKEDDSVPQPQANTDIEITQLHYNNLHSDRYCFI